MFDLASLSDLRLVFDMGTFVDLRLVAWLSLLVISGASGVLWQALLTYDLFPAPYPPHPPRPDLLHPAASPPAQIRTRTTRGPSGEPPTPPPDSSVAPPTPPPSQDGDSGACVVPLRVAQERVRELGGIAQVARRLRLTPTQARRILASERPLPRWVLDELF